MTQSLLSVWPFAEEGRSRHQASMSQGAASPDPFFTTSSPAQESLLDDAQGGPLPRVYSTGQVFPGMVGGLFCLPFLFF